MKHTAVGLLLLVIHSALGQSGQSPFDEEKEEVKVDFECFSTVTLRTVELTCNLLNTSDMDSRNQDIVACEQINSDTNDTCQKMVKTSNGFKLTETDEAGEFRVCAGKNMCKNIKIREIVLADPPFNVTVGYNQQENEYKIAFKEPYPEHEILGGHLRYEIILRKDDEEWPECNQEAILKKMCIETTYTEVLIPGKKLQSSTKYEAKVRARANSDFFKGPWSSWCAAYFFETSSADGRILISSLVILILIILIILIVIFWKSRIKPLLWPEIPDHKKTLEKLCKNAIKEHYITFNPDLYKDAIINKVENIEVKEVEEERISSFPGEEDQFFPCNTKANISGKDFHVTACETSPLPTVKTMGLFPKNHGTQCNIPFDHTSDMETHRAIPAAISNVSQTCARGLNHSSPQDHISTVLSPHVMENQPVPPPDAARETPSGFKVLPWEEAYIAMSAFKTSMSSAK